MRSSNRSGSRGRFFQLLIIAALVIVSRAPFLARGERIFDSDEAVEGLMASHVLRGEHPAFLWGQRYKGVPEVYLTAAVFAVTGAGVVPLKGVTLACFAAFVALQFVLVERLFSRAVAWMATLFLIVAPPSLVLWSLSANAEVVLTLLLGTAACLAFDVWRRTGARSALVASCAALGLGLWVQQFILYYAVALGIAVLADLPRRQDLSRALLMARDVTPWGRRVLFGLALVAFVYVGLGAAAFFTGGFDLTLGNSSIGVHHPQKLWQIATALFVLCAAMRTAFLLARPDRRVARTNVALAIGGGILGYLPAIAGRLAGGGSAPVARMDLTGVVRALPSMAYEIVPIVFGFRSPTTGWLGVPAWLGLAVVVAVLGSCLEIRRRSWTPFFHGLIAVTALLFVLSGAFVNAQSYRYLMPAAGALAVALSLGVWTVFRRSRLAGAALLSVLVVTFAMQQRAWYQTLQPDTQSAAIIECLDRSGARAARADYWVSYKITFLTGERIIVAPNTGADRYPPYQEYVRTQPAGFVVPATIEPPCAPDPSFSR